MKRQDALTKRVRMFVRSRWKLGTTHGVEHWDRVYSYGMQLLNPEVNKRVVSLFAYLHDSCREDDMDDEQHGPRAAAWIETLRASLLKELSDEEFDLLQQACKLHTAWHKTGNPTIDACFDADRLDLWRVGVVPDPSKMATEKGAEIALYTDFEAMIYPELRETKDDSSMLMKILRRLHRII